MRCDWFADSLAGARFWGLEAPGSLETFVTLLCRPLSHWFCLPPSADLLLQRSLLRPSGRQAPPTSSRVTCPQRAIRVATHPGGQRFPATAPSLPGSGTTSCPTPLAGHVGLMWRGRSGCRRSRETGPSSPTSGDGHGPPAATTHSGSGSTPYPRTGSRSGTLVAGPGPRVATTHSGSGCTPSP